MLQEILTGVVFASGTWLLALLVTSIPFIQRHVFYAHKLPIWWRQKLDVPESFGFLHNQVTQWTLKTPDGTRLFAWLVIPIACYLQHETELADVQDNDALRVKVRAIVRGDEERRLVIYFHGNASTVGSTRRTEAYRSISAFDSKSTFVLSFDYRGFGRSTGYPTEQGLIGDAVSVIEWAREELRVPYDRIVLLSQSLGTAVASAALCRYASKIEPVPFAGLIMCAPFTSMADVFMSFQILPHVRPLQPLKYFPLLDNWFRRRLADTWQTSENVRTILENYDKINLTFLHCTRDDVVPWRMTEELANVAHRKLSELGTADITATDLGRGGRVKQWVLGGRNVRQVLVEHGAHNTIMKWAPVALEVVRTLQRSNN